MTEAEWLACKDWRVMFDSIEGKVSSRQLRLFAVACCRVAWTLLNDESRRAVEVAERFADGLATGGDLRTARERFRATGAEQSVEIIRGVRYRPDFGGSTADEDVLWAAKSAMRQSADKAAWSVLRSTGRDFTDKDLGRALNAEMTIRRDLFHDVLGPLPFRHVAFNPEWLTSTAVAIARQMYESRDFSPMPILADALQDAGCDKDEILTHCRGPGQHVRGCWVVDLVLGKQ